MTVADSGLLDSGLLDAGLLDTGLLDTGLLDVEGPAAPPRSNGELMFAEPWESRAFGIGIALHAEGLFDWEDFRQQLIAAIGRWEASGAPPEEWSYYSCWLEALETVLAAKGLVEPGMLEERAQAILCLPPGHDHHDGHGHEHGHGH